MKIQIEKKMRLVLVIVTAVMLLGIFSSGAVTFFNSTKALSSGGAHSISINSTAVPLRATYFRQYTEVNISQTNYQVLDSPPPGKTRYITGIIYNLLNGAMTPLIFFYVNPGGENNKIFNAGGFSWSWSIDGGVPLVINQGETLWIKTQQSPYYTIETFLITGYDL